MFLVDFKTLDSNGKDRCVAWFCFVIYVSVYEEYTFYHFFN